MSALLVGSSLPVVSSFCVRATPIDTPGGSVIAFLPLELLHCLLRVADVFSQEQRFVEVLEYEWKASGALVVSICTLTFRLISVNQNGKNIAENSTSKSKTALAIFVQINHFDYMIWAD